MDRETVDYRERRYTSQDGLSLYYRDYGDPLSPATAVLCLGGLTRNCKDFDGLAAHLAGTRRVICPDYRGRGRSDRDPDWRNYLPGTYVNDAMHLLAATNIHRVVVVGTSLGGLVAMALAVAVPSALAGAVLNDIGPEINGGGLDAIIGYIAKDRPQTDWAGAERTLREMLPNLRFQDDGSWAKLVRNTFRAGDDGRLHFDWDPAIVKPLIAGRAKLPDMWPLFRALADIPVLALRGEHSDLLTPECFAAMAVAMPAIECVEIPGAGHAPTLDEPESRAALDGFLARI